MVLNVSLIYSYISLTKSFCYEHLFQILNVYITKYDSGGQFWPIAHNTTVFSLLVAQLIALGVFGLKRSSVASGFTIPLLIGTLLFHQYCRQRFLPVFRSNSAQVNFPSHCSAPLQGSLSIEIISLLRLGNILICYLNIISL